jgi:hypothetical protein
MSRHIQAVNQPDRISWNSSSGQNAAFNAQAYQFQVPLITPALEVEEIQLLRATVPQVNNAIPAYQGVFWFYELPTPTTVPDKQYLWNVRLAPIGYSVPPQYNSIYTTSCTNLTGGATELVQLLNVAAAPLGDTVGINPRWGVSKITFTLETSGPFTGAITCKGADAAKYYTPAGYNDPNVLNMYNGVNGAGYNPPSLALAPVSGTTLQFIRQPFANGSYLNQRLGYSMSGTALGRFAAASSTYINLLYANSYNITYPGAVDIPPDSFYNIEGTSVVSVYGTFSGSGGNSTEGNRLNLLSVVPMSQVTGFTNFTGTGLKAPLYKVMNDIYVMDIELRDENDQPFYVPDGLNVNIEIGFKYKNSNKPRDEIRMAHY